MAESVSERVLVRADPDAVLDVITDVEAYPEWQEEVERVEILESDEDGWATRVRFLLDAKVFRTTFVLAYEYGDDWMSWTLVEGDQLRRNDGRYEVHDQGNGMTELVYSLTVEPAMPLPGIVRRRAAKRIVDAALRNVAARVESRV
jgi:ribosome-associated toxin RatA of RatAB toxin-antitoxin module